MYNGRQGLYQTGSRFSLAGMYGSRSQLADGGITIDCNDPANANVVDCVEGGGAGGGIDLTQLISQGLTDVTQLLRPGTPSPVRVYTPTSTAATSLFANPIAAIAFGLGGLWLARKVFK